MRHQRDTLGASIQHPSRDGDRPERGGGRLRASVAANVRSRVRGHTSGAMPSSVGWLLLISQNATRHDGPALTSAKRQHARRPAFECVCIEASGEIVPGHAKQRPQCVALAHQQMKAVDSALLWQRDEPQRLDGSAHGMQASIAALSAARMSRLSVIGSTMLERTADFQRKSGAHQSSGVDQHAGRGAFVEAVALKIARSLRDGDEGPARSASVPASRATIAASMAGGG